MLKAKEEEHRLRMIHQDDLIKLSLKTQEAERVRIASDLHDNIINLLTVIRIKASLKTSDKEIDSLLQTVINESRRISHDLIPPMFEIKPIHELISEIINKWNNQFDIDYFSDVRFSNMLSPDFKISVVRVIQELLNNIYKHAETAKISFHLRITSKTLSFIIIDSGKGFEQNSDKGIGLKNIELRSKNLNAKYKFKSKLNFGTRFIFVLPIS